jgi:hypothetical protein
LEGFDDGWYVASYYKRNISSISLGGTVAQNGFGDKGKRITSMEVFT